MRKGFTLIELMIVVVIIGILAAIAIPNFVKIIDKAKESSVKANMHTMQVTVETINVDSAGVYPRTSTPISDGLPGNFKNPYTNATGSGAWQLGDGSTTAVGMVYYTAAADGSTYQIVGYGKTDYVDLTLIPGSTD